MLLVCVSALTSIIAVYAVVSNEDHVWWWRCFLSSAGAGIWLWLYSVAFFAFKININHTVGTILYFGYMFIASLCLGMLCGSVGLIAGFRFVRKLYGSVNVDSVKPVQGCSD